MYRRIHVPAILALNPGRDRVRLKDAAGMYVLPSIFLGAALTVSILRSDWARGSVRRLDDSRGSACSENRVSRSTRQRVTPAGHAVETGDGAPPSVN